MSTLVLDTSGYTRALDAHPGAVALLRKADRILLPTITLGELYYGFQFGSRSEWNLERLTRFLENPRIEIVDATHNSAERYGMIFAFLRRQGTPIPSNDIWIAAIAMVHGATVVTADKHFQHMPQIVTELLE